MTWMWGKTHGPDRANALATKHEDKSGQDSLKSFGKEMSKGLGELAHGITESMSKLTLSLTKNGTGLPVGGGQAQVINNKPYNNPITCFMVKRDTQRVNVQSQDRGQPSETMLAKSMHISPRTHLNHIHYHPQDTLVHPSSTPMVPNNRHMPPKSTLLLELQDLKGTALTI